MTARIADAALDIQKRFLLSCAADEYAIRNCGFDPLATRTNTLLHFAKEFHMATDVIADAMCFEEHALERSRAHRLLTESEMRYFEAMSDDDRRDWYRGVYAVEALEVINAFRGANE